MNAERAIAEKDATATRLIRWLYKIGWSLPHRYQQRWSPQFEFILDDTGCSPKMNDKNGSTRMFAFVFDQYELELSDISLDPILLVH